MNPQRIPDSFDLPDPKPEPKRTTPTVPIRIHEPAEHESNQVDKAADFENVELRQKLRKLVTRELEPILSKHQDAKITPAGGVDHRRSSIVERILQRERAATKARTDRRGSNGSDGGSVRDARLKERRHSTASSKDSFASSKTSQSRINLIGNMGESDPEIRPNPIPMIAAPLTDDAITGLRSLIRNDNLKNRQPLNIPTIAVREPSETYPVRDASPKLETLYKYTTSLSSNASPIPKSEFKEFSIPDIVVIEPSNLSMVPDRDPYLISTVPNIKQLPPKSPTPNILQSPLPTIAIQEPSTTDMSPRPLLRQPSNISQAPSQSKTGGFQNRGRRNARISLQLPGGESSNPQPSILVDGDPVQGKRRRSSSITQSGGYYGKCKKKIITYCRHIQIVPCPFNDQDGDDVQTVLRDILLDDLKLCPPGITDKDRYHVDSLFCTIGTGEKLNVSRLQRDDIRNSIYEFAAQVIMKIIYLEKKKLV